MTDTDALIELVDGLESLNNPRANAAWQKLVPMVGDLAREVIALRAEIARRDKHWRSAIGTVTPTTDDYCGIVRVPEDDHDSIK